MYMKPARSHKNPTELNERQKLFCIEYLKDLNASAACLRAGYPKNQNRVCSTRLLAHVGVQKYLTKQFNARTKEAEVSVDEVLKGLKEIAYIDPAEAYDEDGKLKSIHDMPLALRRSIASIETDEIWEFVESTNGRKIKEQVGWTKKVKFWPKDRGLEMLGKYLAMFTDKHEMSGPGGQPLPSVTVNVIKTVAPAINREQTLVAPNAA